ncbi:MAG TPA: hypothetical protein VFQ61_01320 [Polyangiaceae bacterium]|nr:hypothetical protein [Polyangiaceae bacterium]
MSKRPEKHLTLRSWLEVTQDEEVDCDRFGELLAQWIDGRIEDPRLVALLEHHRRLCHECDEGAALVAAAVGAQS